MRLMHAVIVEYECTNYENWYFNDGDDQYDTCTNFMKNSWSIMSILSQLMRIVLMMNWRVSTKVHVMNSV